MCVCVCVCDCVCVFVCATLRYSALNFLQIAFSASCSVENDINKKITDFLPLLARILVRADLR